MIKGKPYNSLHFNFKLLLRVSLSIHKCTGELLFFSPPATPFSIEAEENLFLLLVARNILKLLFAGAFRG